MVNVMSAGYFLGCVVGLIVHEAGHVCAARPFGLRLKRIGLTWRGPYVIRETGAPMVNVIVSAAGPLVNLVLAALAWHDLRAFAFANLILGLANLVPTRNSDGRRILRELSLAGNRISPMHSGIEPGCQFIPQGAAGTSSVPLPLNTSWPGISFSGTFLR
jgi:Zn-dependent protease